MERQWDYSGRQGRDGQKKKIRCREKIVFYSSELLFIIASAKELCNTHQLATANKNCRSDLNENFIKDLSLNK